MLNDKRALTEDLIRDADGLFVGLLRNAMIGVYIIQDNLFRYANPRFAEIFGYTQAEICGAIGPRDLIAPGEENKVLGAISQRLDGQAETAHYVFTGRRKDGGLIDLEVFGNRTAFEGRPAIIGMLVDITARCAAERIANEQLNFIGQLIEAIPSPLFFKDEKARYLGCNKAFEAFIMRPRDTIIGRSVFDISPPELAARYHEADKALFDHPGVQTYEASVEATDGMRRDVIFNKATWLHADGSLGGLVGVITDITERKQTEALVWVQANYDPLTGLPNRRLLHDRLGEVLKKAHRDHESVAVLYIDLDRFKEVNDTLGHEAGDRLLSDAARRIVSCVRESDTVARQGGDEFTVLLPGLSDRTPIERIDDNAVITTDGLRHPADILVYATGFRVNDMLSSLQVFGEGGVELHDAWGARPAAYLGITVNRFPNLFMMYGPGTHLAHGASLIFNSECQMHYIDRCLAALIDGGHRSMEVRPERLADWHRRHQEEMSKLVWSQPSIEHSYYKNSAGEIHTVMPFRVVDYWTWTRDLDPDDYTFD